MAMSASIGGENGPLVEMNTTPLIDVLLVLLIMFIITLPVMTHSTTLQLHGKPAITVPEIINVDIEFDGTVLWNGVVVQDFEQLEQFFRVESARANQADLQVRPDRRATYDTVARVLAIAQRSGMKRIGVGSVLKE
jgi:biopolymer transport protein ExbD